MKMNRFASLFMSLALAIVALTALPPPIVAGSPNSFVGQSLMQVNYDVVAINTAEVPALSDNVFVESDRGAAQDLRLVQQTIGVTGTMPRPGPEPCSTGDNCEFIYENIESIAASAGMAGSRSFEGDVIPRTGTDSGLMEQMILRGLASVRMLT